MEKSGGCFFAHRARSLILFVHVSLPRLLGGVDPAAEGQSFQPSKELVRTTGTGLLGSMRYAYFYRPSRSEITRIMLPSFWRARLPRQGKRRSIAFQESGYGPSDGWMKQCLSECVGQTFLVLITLSTLSLYRPQCNKERRLHRFRGISCCRLLQGSHVSRRGKACCAYTIHENDLYILWITSSRIDG
ncbi:hypothetical protein BDV35DRAFT_200336 [Aspergillus flavus]|uniref:Secreted protein n=1 Tax=Aspergillus flavus TaxID=5059 RepID=A0A5N6H3P2_ASPFL|nr:hypothetical protein BDV35DRAFT_200336 [Aspergillus flavus]